jgi:glycosyltransferase involved in cell wall biosynthesis
MHIVFLTHEYPKSGFPHGGVGTFIQIIAKWLVQNGIDVSVVGINYTREYEEENDEGVYVYRLKSQKIKGFTWLLQSKSINSKLQNIEKKKSIDIIEGTELSLAFIQKKPKIKYLIRLNGGHHYFAESEKRPINWWKGFQEKRSFSKADAVIGVSQYVLDHTSKYILFESKKKGVIYNPANLKNFYESDPLKIVKGRIFFAGTVCEKKGIRQLIEAMPIIKKIIPEAHLQIAGRDWTFPGTNVSYIEYVKKLIDPSVKDDITFLGQIPNEEIPKLIEQAEVCCYPSHMEAMPLAWIEVMAMGKTFVGSLTGPGPEILEHGVNGLQCNPYEPTNIAAQVIYMLQNPERARLMGVNARVFALNNFSLDIIGTKNLSLYSSLK